MGLDRGRHPPPESQGHRLINPHAFGGDPRDVTVVGPVRRAMSACALFTSLAAKMIILSGLCLLRWPASGL
ncbi:carboxylesterase family protein [Actinomadura sp. RB99]|uniref:carboxylesterase family protein n=1 Tax=Actinomadura sp. RB99 TaxID=2691577 RepID=UPI00168452BB|nr:carboxylesterase family protein [Actinomadura sp. RB99]